MRQLSWLILAVGIAASIDSSPGMAGQGLERVSPDESAGNRVVSAPAWETGIQQLLAAREYGMTWQDRTQLEELPAAWHATNRAQGFRTYFTPEGMTTIPRVAGEPAWRLSLSTTAFGRGKISLRVKKARLVANENHIQLDHSGIVEFLVNDSQGLKHGFALRAPPDGRRDPSDIGIPVHLDLMVGGSLTPAVAADGQSIRFTDSSGRDVLHSRDWKVHDATGRTLPAWMEAHSSSDVWTIRLLANDDRAVYPLTSDPLTTTAAWLGEVDQASARFGVSVGSAGDVNGDGYDDVIVGAFHYDNGQLNEGAAFLFSGSSDGPSLTPAWMVEGDQAVALAGRAVGAAGDVNGDGFADVVVGAPGLDPGGRVWGYYGSPAGLAVEADWEVKGFEQMNPSFGSSLGTAGDVNGDGFDDVIVGAPIDDVGGSYLQDGRAYVYHGSASGLSIFPNWEMQGNQANAKFGISVGAAGDVNGDGYDDVIVGAYMFDNGQSEEGRAFVYYGSVSGLTTEPAWIYENNLAHTCLGGRVSTAGDVNDDGYGDVLVGASYNCEDVGSGPVGRTYAFYGSSSGLASIPDWITELFQIGASFGRVATAGDVNNDGFDDIIVGAPYYDNDLPDEGAVFLYLGSEAGLSSSHDWMVEGNQPNTRFGFGLNAAGDVDGSGVDDVVIGAYEYQNGEDDEGAAFVFLGSSGIDAAGWVEADTPLVLAKTTGDEIQLSWGSSCLASDLDYEVYEGPIGEFGGHVPRLCTTEGQTETALVPVAGGTYYLVVPTSRNGEGSYGVTSAGVERPQGTPSCLPQAIGSCE